MATHPRQLIFLNTNFAMPHVWVEAALKIVRIK
jgi:hypothetical protein